MVKKSCLRKHGCRNFGQPFPPLKKTNKTCLTSMWACWSKRNCFQDSWNSHLPRVSCIYVFILAPILNRKGICVALLCLLTIALKQHVKERFPIWKKTNISVHRWYNFPTWKAYDALQVKYSTRLTHPNDKIHFRKKGNIIFLIMNHKI